MPEAVISSVPTWCRSFLLKMAATQRECDVPLAVGASFRLFRSLAVHLFAKKRRILASGRLADWSGLFAFDHWPWLSFRRIATGLPDRGDPSQESASSQSSTAAAEVLNFSKQRIDKLRAEGSSRSARRAE